MDDSGARDPDKKAEVHPRSQDWYALGGLLVHESDLDAASNQIRLFRERWPEMGAYPLHSYEIRNCTKRFLWLAEALPSKKAQFLGELTALVCSLPIYVLACVIDRPCYNKRYRDKYTRRWMLCKSAFAIAVERATKYAKYKGARLRVFVERTDKTMEAQLRGYYEQLRTAGPPFDDGNSARHTPLAAADFKATLLEFRVKGKESDLMQIADLVLWPICKGGYDPDDRVYKILKDAGKLLEVVCTDANGLKGTKYYCFDA